jgi:1-aminocyclopropane-1-carboxylate deaminase
MVNLKAASIESLNLHEFFEKNIHADVLRLDKVDDVISGNKWFKLKYYLEEAIVNNHKTIITFGGAYSNHIIATACAAKISGLKSVGIIRGGEPASLSHTLLEAKKYGMQLEFISREEYKRKNEPGFLKQLSNTFRNSFIIPEGGEGILGVKGSAEILDGTVANNYSHILCATGTGTMFAGIVNAAAGNQKIMGISVLKGMNNLLKEISLFINYPNRPVSFEINHEYHFGGYAKKNNELIQFMNYFFESTGIPSDFVYTAKLFYAVMDLLSKNYFPSRSRLLIIHSGGLQGNQSLPAGTLIF